MIPRVLWLSAVVLSMCSTAMGQQPRSTPAHRLVAADRVLVIAHRGASAAAPENTQAAFELALKAQPDMVELDYYHSADGVPFVFHDKTLDRTTNAVALWGRQKVSTTSIPWDQLKTLDAGRWFDAAFAGEAIPSLDDAIDTIQSGSVTLIERKQGDSATIVNLLTRKRLLDQVVVQAFDWEYLAKCRQMAPTLVLGALGSKELGPRQLEGIRSCGASVVGWKYSDVGRAEVERVHAAGLKLWVYTVDDPAEMQRLIKLGVDGLITNKPEAARRIVAAGQLK